MIVNDRIKLTDFKMIILANTLLGLGQILHGLIMFFNILIFASVVMSWVSADPRNPLVQFVRNTTDPIFYRVRRYVPPVGMLDLSPLLVIFGLMLIDTVVVNSLVDYAVVLRRDAMSVVVQ